MKNSDVKIVKGNKGYKILDIKGYDYTSGGSIEILGCMFNVDEKELVDVIELNGNEILYINNDNQYSNKDEYLRNYNDENLYITPFVEFSSYKNAETILNWLELEDCFKTEKSEVM